MVTLRLPEYNDRPVVTCPIIGPAAETAAEPEPEAPAVPVFAPAKQEEPEIEQTTFVPPSAAPWRIAGEVLDTYIVCEDEDKNVWLIDKHAAHERIRFDALKADPVPPMAQQLLTPAAVTLTAEEYGAVLESLDVLAGYGFLCEDFGDGAVLVREIPDYLEPGQVEAALCELAGETRYPLSSGVRQQGAATAEKQLQQPTT